jgi:hypothetical protein
VLDLVFRCMNVLIIDQEVGLAQPPSRVGDKNWIGKGEPEGSALSL